MLGRRGSVHGVSAFLPGVRPLGIGNPWFGSTYLSYSGNRAMYRHAVIEHIELTVISVVIGFVISLALALAVRRSRSAETLVLAAADIIYSIPSIALFTLLVPLTGLSLAGPIIGLSAYTLLILIRNILEGLRAVPAEAVEAATGLGYGPVRRVLKVELPLALPTIFAGLRIATVSTVGLITVAFALSHGGLGIILTKGYSNNLYKQQCLDAVIGIVIIAIAFDLLLQLAQRVSTPWTRSRVGA